MTKYALVTGGSRGIGRAVCLELAQAGYHILLNYRSNDAEAQNTVNSIQKIGRTATLLRFDVSSSQEVETILGTWLNNNPEAAIEILVNNAGLRRDGLMMMMSEEDWHQVIDISLHGFYYITKLVLRTMIYKKYGRIVNIVSMSGLKGLPGQTNYSASKAAVIGATKALSQEVAKKGITVNAIAPGFILTDMTEGINEADYKSIIPVGRFGQPEEVAHAVSFLASPKAAYITGEVLCINGGLH